jgi:hypothetical protein
MKLSELIADAVRTYEEFGDIHVVVPDPGCGCCAGGFDDAETRIEKSDQEVWVGGKYVKVSTAYVVS